MSKLKKARRASRATSLRHQFLKKERERHHPAPDSSLPPPDDGDWRLEQSPEENLRQNFAHATSGRVLQGGGGNSIAPGADPAGIAPASALSSKRFRYTLELFEQFYGSEMERAAEAMKGVQDRLGAINDCAATIDLLAGWTAAPWRPFASCWARANSSSAVIGKPSSPPASWPGGSAGSAGPMRFANPRVRRLKPQTSFSFSFFMR